MDRPRVILLFLAAAFAAAAAQTRITITHPPATAADPPVVRVAKARTAAPAKREPIEAPRPQPVEPAPPIGWTTAATVVEVYDADTIVVEVRRTFRVRLIGVWAPEVRTRDREEKARGIAARDWLRQQLPVGSPLVLHVPATESAGQAWSMSRLLGKCWMPGDDRPLSARIIEAGHATREKPAR